MGEFFSPFITRPHLFQSVTCIINDFFTVFLGESRFLGIRKDIQNHLRRTAKFREGANKSLI